MTNTTTLPDVTEDAPIPYRVVHTTTKLVRAACFVAFITLAALSFLLAIASATSPRTFLSVFGHDILIVRSGSMSPTFNTGDAVFIERIDDLDRSDLEVGQVVTFRAAENPDLIITHRIIDVITPVAGDVTYVTKGDANQSSDGTALSPGRVIGVMTGRVPRAGFVLFALQHPKISGLFLVALILAHAGVLATMPAVPQQENRENNET